MRDSDVIPIWLFVLTSLMLPFVTLLFIPLFILCFDSANRDYQFLFNSIIFSVLTALVVLGSLKLGTVWQDRKNERSAAKRVIRDMKILSGFLIAIGYIPCVIVGWYGANNKLIALYACIVANVSIAILHALFTRAPHFFAMSTIRTLRTLFISLGVHVTFTIVFAISNGIFRTGQDAALVLAIQVIYSSCVIAPNMGVFHVICKGEVELDGKIEKKMRREQLVRSAGAECEICRFFYDKETHTPQYLPECGHTLCNNCILGILEQCLFVSLQCPFCRTANPDVNFEKLPKNEFVLKKLRKSRKIKPSEIL